MFAKTKWRKTDTRPPKAFTLSYLNERFEFAKIFIALHNAGVFFSYVDEYSTNEKVQKQWGWVSKLKPQY